MPDDDQTDKFIYTNNHSKYVIFGTVGLLIAFAIVRASLNPWYNKDAMVPYIVHIKPYIWHHSPAFVRQQMYSNMIYNTQMGV